MYLAMTSTFVFFKASSLPALNILYAVSQALQSLSGFPVLTSNAIQVLTSHSPNRSMRISPWNSSSASINCVDHILETTSISYPLQYNAYLISSIKSFSFCSLSFPPLGIIGSLLFVPAPKFPVASSLLYPSNFCNATINDLFICLPYNPSHGFNPM